MTHNRLDDTDLGLVEELPAGQQSWSGSLETKGKVEDANFATRSISNSSLPEHGGVAPAAHVFQDPEVAEYYRQVYERSKYEGRHLYDPEFSWEPAEEKKLLFKTDWYVCFWCFLMFLALDIDRYNLGNAVSDNLLGDLKLTTADYNLGNTINLVCFLSAELPSQLISKKVGPDRWIPTQICLWSIVAILQCTMKNRAGFLVTRCLVGLLEGGFIPDVVLWMSYFYKSSELSVRVGYFYLANPLTSAISSLIAYGIFHLNGHKGWEGWRWLFLIEGLVTLVVGLIAFFKMPPSVTQTRTWYRKKGWYTDREEKIMVNRVLRDDPTKGDMHNREAITFKSLLRSLFEYDLWPVYIDRLFIDMIAVPVQRYLPLLLKGMGFSTLNTNLLMIPPNIIECIMILVQVHSSRFFKEYGLHLLLSPVWWIPCILAIKFWPGFLVNKWGTYALLCVALGGPPSWVLSVSWLSHNSGTVRTRTVSSSVVNIFSQTASIIASNIYRPDDAPKYHRGNKQLVAITFTAVFVTSATKVYYVWKNKTRAAKWDAMTEEEQNEYRKTTTDKGNKRLDFRFAT